METTTLKTQWDVTEDYLKKRDAAKLNFLRKLKPRLSKEAIAGMPKLKTVKASGLINDEKTFIKNDAGEYVNNKETINTYLETLKKLSDTSAVGKLTVSIT